jgi:predicted metalloprotease with PDZ domain
VAEVCGCTVREFFDRYVRGASPIDFDRYLALIGLRSRVSWAPALGADGRPEPDLRVFGWLPEGERAIRLRLWNPTSIWIRAGLHTGDRIVTVNGEPLAGMADFRRLFGSLRIGDTVRVEVARASGAFSATVVVAGYDWPVVRLEELPGAAASQRALRTRWLAGEP